METVESYRRVIEEKLRQIRQEQQRLALEEGQLLTALTRIANEQATRIEEVDDGE